MNVLFINGWGISQSAARNILDTIDQFDSIAIVQPVRQWVELAASLAGQADMVIGYSTGAFLLMGEPELAASFRRRVLLASFLDFKAESGLGGKTRVAQLKFLLRWLKSDPVAALEDFYERAGLDFEIPNELPVSPIDLSWGIERLLKDSHGPDALHGFESYIGSNDSLMEAHRLIELAPDLEVLDGVGHDLRGLVTATFGKGIV